MHHQDGYDYSEPYTVGGPSATYSFRSPFPDRSEVAVLSVVFTDSGYILVSPEAGPMTLANTTNLGANGVARGVAFNGTANFNITPDAIFWPVGVDQSVFVNVSVTAPHAGLVTMIFRRAHGTRQWITPFEVQPEADDTYHKLREQGILQLESQGERRGKPERDAGSY